MGPVEQKVKNFYNSCLLESDGFHQDIRKKTLSSLRLLIKQVGGWSFSDIDNTTTTTTTAANWRFQTALQNIHHLGVWPLFEITVDVDEMDPTKNIFKIGIGSNFMDPHIHPISGTPENDTTLNGPLYSQFLSESFEKYMKETIRIMKLLAGKSVNASMLAYHVSVMEKTFVQMKSTSSQESYNVSTIHDLTIRYPMINWMKYFTSLASIRHISIKSTDRVAILYPDYLSHLSVFLNDVKTNATKAETLRNYLIVSLIRSMLPFFEESNLEEEEKDSDSILRIIITKNVHGAASRPPLSLSLSLSLSLFSHSILSFFLFLSFSHHCSLSLSSLYPSPFFTVFLFLSFSRPCTLSFFFSIPHFTFFLFPLFSFFLSPLSAYSIIF
ncbi:ECE [Acanthosepion pharaonis]|uniref:ECE n=1 Tax=Acanthosepion pharaonis TaxID=158019 RepID=A0A812BU60_ACAPH|nr:ECE [Sepia pharaonis]